MSYYYSVPKGNQISIGWEDEAKDTVFGGISWSGHFADVSACRELDARIEELESRLDGERATRDQHRTQLAESNRKVITVCWRILSMATIVRCSLAWDTRGEVTTAAA